ncbi:hypothetical protein, partial [Desulfovibrio sp. An276]|uniref:hypothetical protein n=1 Tax=Desulfovibrio sp. An276 TaxID=1965618 RepID=UPI001950DB55
MAYLLPANTGLCRLLPELNTFWLWIYPKSWVKVEPYGYCVNEIIIFSSNYFTPIAVNAIENM